MQNRVRKGQFSLALGLAMALSVVSCDENDPNTSEELLEETAFAENVFAQLSTDIEDALPYDALSSGRHGFTGFGFGFGKCMTRTVDMPEEGDFPKVITIEYDGACASDKEIVKSGKIIITLTGPPREEGSQRIVTFDDFIVNDFEIKGTKTFTYNGQGQFTITLVDGQIITREGDVIIRESIKTRTLIEGAETEERSDDVYEVTGVVNGETTDGTPYKKEIVEPLIIRKDCFWITAGIVQTTIGDETSSVDFGDGTCDNIAKRIGSDGEEEEFTMEMKIKKMRRHKHIKG